jgi:hypothetical protein
MPNPEKSKVKSNEVGGGGGVGQARPAVFGGGQRGGEGPGRRAPGGGGEAGGFGGG